MALGLGLFLLALLSLGGLHLAAQFVKAVR
jgi:hypothetical protein